ncbi:MAG: hypothetical protein ABIR50_01610 [Ginsengibacter sp.]
MDYKKEMNQNQQDALSKLEAYMALKKEQWGDKHQDVHTLKEEWEAAWVKIQEAMLALEQFEI